MRTSQGLVSCFVLRFPSSRPLRLIPREVPGQKASRCPDPRIGKQACRESRSRSGRESRSRRSHPCVRSNPKTNFFFYFLFFTLARRMLRRRCVTSGRGDESEEVCEKEGSQSRLRKKEALRHFATQVTSPHILSLAPGKIAKRGG